jgi:DNA repair exonuclease SbcCD ATPase subunit
MTELLKLIEQFGPWFALGLVLFYTELEKRRGANRLQQEKEAWQLESAKQSQQQVDKLNETLLAVMDERLDESRAETEQLKARVNERDRRVGQLESALETQRQGFEQKLSERDSRIQSLESDVARQKAASNQQIDDLQGQLLEKGRKIALLEKTAARVLVLEEEGANSKELIGTLTEALKAERARHKETQDLRAQESHAAQQRLADLEAQIALISQRAESAVAGVAEVRQMQTATLDKITDKLTIPGGQTDGSG